MTRFAAFFLFLCLSVIAHGQTPNAKDDGRTIQMPVVFHVIHAGSKDSVGRDAILTEIEHLNEDFSAQNDTSFIEENMRHLMGNPNIEFVLHDSIFEKGYQGIKYINTIIPVGRYPRLFSPLIDSGACLNIYVYRMQGASTPVPGDYIRINFDYIGNGTHTLTHEVGHAFGLWHLWGKTNCSFIKSLGARFLFKGSDGVADTPRQFRCTDMAWKHTDCPVDLPKFKRRNYNNFMDYSACRCMFTKGQVTVMRNTIIERHPGVFEDSPLPEKDTD